MESNTSKQVYTPHLKRVLRSFQASAHSSLHGPNSVMGVWSTATEKAASSTAESGTTSSTSTTTLNKAPEEQDPFTAPPPFPIQQPPIFTPPDQSGWVPSETILENETISCFTVGGEKRLCLPQILNTVLRGFSLQQINCVCDTLHIFCSRCTIEQLEVLKGTGILPLSAPSCGLITKSDAERLCSALRDSNPPKVIRNPDAKPPFQVRVYHECFGHCTGLYTPDLYLDPLARCIECAECHGLFSPHKFVCHAHHIRENRTCHWGFDSFNWRSYLLLDSELENDPQMMEILKEMKNRYDYCYDYSHKFKRKQMLAEARETNKKLRMESMCPYTCALDPAMVYWYSNPPWGTRVAPTFKPFTPLVTKDEKSVFIPPEALPHFLRERSSYFLHDPSLLHNTDHIIPISENERFDSHFHTSSVSSSGVKRICLSDRSHLISQADTRSTDSEVVMRQQPVFKKEHNYNANPCCFDSEDTFSDTTSSTLSASTEDGLTVALEEEDTSTQSSDLLTLTCLLTDNNVDSFLRTRILNEVEAVIAKYQKCLSTSQQSKKRIQIEYEKINAKLQQKVHRLQEKNKYMIRELRKSQEKFTLINKPVSRPSSSTGESSETQTPLEEDKSAENPSESENLEAGIKPKESESSSVVSVDSLETSTEPKQLSDVKLEPVGN